MEAGLVKIVTIYVRLVNYHFVDVKSEVQEKYLLVSRYFSMLLHKFFHFLELLKVFSGVFDAVSYFEHLHLDDLLWIIYGEIKENCFGRLLILSLSRFRIGSDGLFSYFFETFHVLYFLISTSFLR